MLVELNIWNVLWVCASLVCGYLFLRSRFISHPQRLPSDRKSVLITGCGRGFGFLLCQRLADLGYKVFACCRSVEGKGAKELKSYSSNIRVLQLDVKDDLNIDNVAKIVSEELGETEMWAIVNNAGISHLSEMEWTTLDTIMDVCNVNMFGMVRVTQRFLPFLKRSKGRIINVNSMAAEISLLGFGGYTMSKAAAKSFTDIMRMELKKWDIDVINVAPYFYSTNINDINNLAGQTRNEWKRSEPALKEGLRDDYVERFIRVSTKFLRLMNNPNVVEVVDCLEDGVTSASPNLCYRPGNLTSKLLTSILSLCPISLRDYIVIRGLRKITLLSKK